MCIRDRKYKVMQEGIIANGDLPTMFSEGLVAMIENTTGGMTSIASSGINFGAVSYTHLNTDRFFLSCGLVVTRG